jgi:CO/xanthine dehydrogenase FAD-binding subunit
MLVEYLVPADVDSAVGMLGAGGAVLAGGTDLYPQHVGRPLTTPVIDIGGIAELRGIHSTADAYRIGALTRWADVASASLPARFDGLRAAAIQVGSVQVQNSGTVGGNLCNASPAADGIPPLLSLDASVELTSTAGSRVLSLETFLTGYRQTARRPDELLTAVLIPRDVDIDARSAFLKLGLRRYLVISVVMVAVVVAKDPDDLIAEARVAVGACSPVAERLRSLEARLVGRSPGEFDVAMIAEHLSALSPIDDVRATADYRRVAAAELVRRALQSCGGDQ